MHAPQDPAGPTDTPDLAGLLLDGLHRTLHRAEQRLDLIGRLLQEEAGDELVHVAPTLIHLGRERKDTERRGDGRGLARGSSRTCRGAGVCVRMGTPLLPVSRRLERFKTRPRTRRSGTELGSAAPLSAPGTPNMHHLSQSSQ